MKLRSIFVRTSRILKSQRFGVSPSSIYTDGFYRDAVDRHEAQSAAAVIDTICEVFRPASIFDIGCGNGIYLHAAARKGIVAAGCDGSEAGVRLCPSDVFVFQHDLRKPLKLNRRFDLCLCFEVAEHIPANHSALLVESCSGASDTALFSSAPKGQGGHDHINEQPQHFWDALFARKGFTLDELSTKIVRDLFRERSVVSWLCKNSRVYRRG